MKQIHENPYRIAGLLANSTERELQKQKAKITRYISVGRVVDSEYDFSFLRQIDRSESVINKAFSGIEQNQDRVMHALFWFLKVNPFDETAINHLINGHKEKAIEIWEKVTAGKGVSPKNFSCISNLATLKLLGGSKTEIQQGLEAKIMLIESDCFQAFIQTVADETYSEKTEKQIEKFISEVLPHLKKKYSDAGTLQLFKNCNGSCKQFLTQKFSDEPIHKIEAQLEKVKQGRRENKAGLYKLGKKLIADCKSDLNTLKSVLGQDNLTYKVISDNLAKEILQCGIDYFNEMIKQSNPAKESLELLEYALSITQNTQTRQRIEENIKVMKNSEVESAVESEINFITQQLNQLQNSSFSISKAKNFVNACKPKLNTLKSSLGANNEVYLTISGAIANNAQGALIQVVNEAQNDFTNRMTYDRFGALNTLKSIIVEAVDVSTLIGTLDMPTDIRTRYKENHNALMQLAGQLASIPTGGGGYSSAGGSSGKKGCYIATMAYGSYEHPQVIELRRFRDDFLSKSIAGRLFIRTYYKYSPALVEKLKEKEQINRIIRTLLNSFIKLIRS
ncbi:CFI-box-CTERM domain-containing protein [Parabacteroides sp. PF5-9]|uniref:CFI-box-CTERM domain-containing protein n=1 Tax=Parabacteroides sp. PF5-9 TaxID=1742404 RepID=UPI0024730751|nr:CFI-box-CTERM domain-containing protein [Parabacteroides sp. PF5-9]MDH6357369.1 hypothetical protein [Parabacteroides sp. PF5-9]